jgi:hypothetical protein
VLPIGADGYPYIEMDPDATLDIEWDFAPKTNGQRRARSDYLETGETIASITVTASANLTIADGTGTLPAPAIAGGNRVVAWVVQPSTVEVHYATCSIVTSAGREDDRTIEIRVREK